MKKHILAATLSATALMASAQVDPNAVLLNVNGNDITVGEFEYLFNKNNTQQLQPQSLDEYLQMFIDYKLKVADAEKAGMQNSAEFRREYNSFRNDLSAPYLRDADVEERLVQEALDHRRFDVLVSHIMLPLENGYEAQLDSLRQAILSGSVTFEDVARQYSIDRNSNSKGGLMGFVVPDRFPWAFEKASYDTPVGQISEVINSGMGFHIVRPEKRTPVQGEVNASHILLMTRGMDDAAKAAVKVRIDSIYDELNKGADFADLAKRFSQDPGSARNGGSLGWFGRGQMVAEFDSVSFALADGETSTPFTTAFGYHIVRRNDHRDASSMDQTALRKQILDNMKGDERGQMPAEATRDRLMKQYNAALDDAALNNVRDLVAANAAGFDTTLRNEFAKDNNTVLARFDHGTVTLSEAMGFVPSTLAKDADNARTLISGAAYAVLRNKVLDYERDNLAATNPDFRNLINEYRDGILLYEIANREVWDRAAKDTKGLEQFFKKNKKKYAWNEPKFKSYIFFASSDSVLNLAKAYADSIGCSDPAAFTKQMRERFGRDIKVERVIAAKGENAITDYLGFDGSKPEADKLSKWTSYGAWNGRIISAPEEAADVRGAAITDYQGELEKQWLAKLHKKYKVKVNIKVLEQLKSQNSGAK